MNFKNTLKFCTASLLCLLTLASCDKKTEEKPNETDNSQVENPTPENTDTALPTGKYDVPLVTSLEITDEVPCDYYSITAMTDGVFKVFADDLSMGLMKADGKLILPCEYSTARSIKDNVTAVRNDMGMWGFFNVDSESFILGCENDSVYDFSEGIGLYSPDGKVYRYIYPDGSVAIDRDFFEAAPFADGLARVFSEIGIGYINKDGKIEIYCDYDNFDDFHEGMARVAEKNVFGYIGKDGELKFNMKSTAIYNYKDGAAAFVVGGLIGYIDKESRVLAEPIYTSPDRNRTDEYFRFECGVAPVMKDGRYGFINKEGELVIDAIYDDVHYAVDGIIRVRNNKLYGYITTDGEKITDCIFEEAGLFHSGVAKVRKDGKYYFINKEGTDLCAEHFDDATEFSDGTAFAVKQGTEQWTRVTVGKSE